MWYDWSMNTKTVTTMFVLLPVAVDVSYPNGIAKLENVRFPQKKDILDALKHPHWMFSSFAEAWNKMTFWARG